MSERTMEKARQVVHRLSEWYFAEGGDADPDSPIDRADLDALHELVRIAEATAEMERRQAGAYADVAAVVRRELDAPGAGEDVRERVAADADEIWYHWIEGQEDLAIAALRKASDEELARFLDMLARWQKCPKPSDHDALAALRSEAQGEESVLSAARLFVQQARAAGEDRFSDFGVFSAYEGLAEAVDAARPTDRSESDVG